MMPRGDSGTCVQSSASPPTLVSLALIFHIGIAAGAESAEQHSDLRARAAPTGSAPPSAQRSVKARGDAQESAKRLLLGVTTLPPSEVSTAKGHRVHGDAQVHAQQLLLGRRDAPVAGL